MSKLTISLLFIIFGLGYGSLASRKVYDSTLGYLVEHKWIKPPTESNLGQNLLGKKETIILYSGLLILAGLYLLWNHNT